MYELYKCTHISSYYLQCVREIGGCPSILRTDAGTENSTLAFVQPILRHYHNDEFAQERSFRYGPSISNQVFTILGPFNISPYSDRELKHRELKHSGVTYVTN
jgi:hypothetical protein